MSAGSNLPPDATPPGQTHIADRATLGRALARLDPERRAALASLGGALSALEELGELAERAELGDATAAEEFAQLLDALAAERPAPSEGHGFSLRALRSGGLGIPPLPLPGRQPGLPCFIDPRVFGSLGRAVIELSMAGDDRDEKAIDETARRGLWTIFSLRRQVQPLALLHRAELLLAQGRIGRASFGRRAAVVAGLALEGARGGGERTPIMDFPPFPDLPAPRLGFDPCLAAAWGETARASRCFCAETYTITEVRNCTPGREEEAVACVGDCVTIVGRGFGDRRSWALGDRASQVFFQGPRSTRIEATRFLPLPAEGELPAEPSGWSDTRVRVAVPSGALPGDVSMSVLCRTGPGGRPIDLADCGLRTRIRSATSRPFVEALGVLSLDVRAAQGAESVEVGAGAPAVIEAEACQALTLWILAENAESVTARDETGEELDLQPASSAPGQIHLTVTLYDRVDRTFTIEAVSRCGPTEARTVTVRRFFAVTLLPAAQSLLAGGTGALQTRVSCPLDGGGSVRVTLDNRWVGVALPEGIEQVLLAIPSGSDRTAMVPLATAADLCGTARLEATLTAAGAAEHRPGSATVEVEPVAVSTTLSLNAFRGYIDPPILDHEEVGANDLGAIAGVFSADRRELALEFPESISVDPITVRFETRRVTAAHDPETGHFELTLDLRVEAPFVEGSDFRVTLSSRGDLRPSWPDASSARGGTALGDSLIRLGGPWLWEGVAVGEGTLEGGEFAGRRLGVALSLTMLRRDVRACGLEPPFAVPPDI